MELKINSSDVLYLVGALLGVSTIVYFSTAILADLSPTVKASVLFLGFVFFVAAAQYHADDDVLTVVLYLLSAGSYVVFLGYTVFRFSPSGNGVFALLGASSLLFVGLGYAIREKGVRLESRGARVVMAGVVVVGGVAVGVDVVGPQPDVEFDFKDTVSVENLSSEEGVERQDGFERRIVLGKVTVRNGFFLSRDAEVPVYYACVYPSGEVRSVSYVRKGSSEEDGSVSSRMMLSGGETRRFTVTVDAIVLYNRSREGPRLDRAYTNLSTVPVERAESCPPSSDETKVVVSGEVGRMRRR